MVNVNSAKSTEKPTEYVAKKPDHQGYVNYSDTENKTWHTLISRQMQVIENRACDEYMAGLEFIGFSKTTVPQLPDINKKLNQATGWAVEPVPALISFDKFFNLLANKKFPAATFIRTPEELDYLREPDIFHELFGHCPLLTNKIYADFTETYGKLGVGQEHKIQRLLARLYWFTIEFGLIKQHNGLRIYGGGILSSIGETPYCLENNTPQRKPFDVLDILRTPYRIDIYQSIYFVINKFEDLFNIIHTDLISKVKEAIELGDHPPAYPPKNKENKKN